LAVSIEALVVEGRRGTGSMGRSWELVGGHWWHAFGTLLVAALLTGLVNTLITSPFGATSWVAQAVATTITLPYGALVGVLLYLDLRARKETLTPATKTPRPRSRRGYRTTPPAATPSCGSGSSWPIWAWPTG
jgi:hypothetical protein